VTRVFRRHGWKVVPAADGAEARRLAASLGAEQIVLQTDLPEESGWLTCAKLNVGGNSQSVILVAGQEDERDGEFAEFVGAVRIITREDGVEPLLQEAGLGVPVSQVV
jgi:DNA-binding response OmpR family regulator